MEVSIKFCHHIENCAIRFVSTAIRLVIFPTEAAKLLFLDEFSSTLWLLSFKYIPPNILKLLAYSSEFNIPFTDMFNSLAPQYHCCAMDKNKRMLLTNIPNIQT